MTGTNILEHDKVDRIVTQTIGDAHPSSSRRNTHLEIFQWIPKGRRTIKTAGLHAGLTVSRSTWSTFAEYERLKKAGVEFHTEPKLSACSAHIRAGPRRQYFRTSGGHGFKSSRVADQSRSEPCEAETFALVIQAKPKSSTEDLTISSWALGLRVRRRGRLSKLGSIRRCFSKR